MATLTVWDNPEAAAVKLAQLSDDEADGTASEQIELMSTLDAYAGFQCVSENYTGPVPSTDPALWRWNGSQIVAVQAVPELISPRQFRLQALAMGILQQIETWVAGQSSATKIAWEYSTEFRRNNIMFNQAADALGYTEAQKDAFFIAASQL
jgi:hypothetical protein